MAKILGIGVATLDIINTTDGFPHEDSKVRAISQRINRGGNVCNSLTVLSQLGHHCFWCGTLGDDTAAKSIQADLGRQGIDIQNSLSITDGHTPTSYINVNRNNGSRTIVHYRDLAELSMEHFAQIDLSPFDCCHFEGRNIETTERMVSHLKRTYPRICISIEIEKPRANIETLFPHADILFIARDYIEQNEQASATEFLNQTAFARTREHAIVVCTWGSQGAWLSTPEQAIHHQHAIKADNLIDTLGAGDTFIAGFLHQWLLDKDARRAVEFAAGIAAKKCKQIGFENLL